ncbi:non-ribosomal peptide synthetase [Pedobacter roseus]|uniref:Amino acid adenylation domain-containing protein n=1 Tax=Pedobacter roseus TaxID=336820 RepID=A0A7G9QKQ7_9SPHI|nr:non-ribosomal peptide synthetase [Pedobacter roseus]QNN43932.1 amino acid adenylation domain-containing protein [Pedobacter roseus]
MIEELYLRLKELNVSLSVVGEKLNITAPKGILQKELIEKIKANKDGLLKYILLQSQSRSTRTIPVTISQGRFILSSSQTRLWVLCQFIGANEAYNTYGAYVFSGALDSGALYRSFLSLLSRHEILRTVFRGDDDGSVFQVVLDVDMIGFSLGESDHRGSDRDALEGVIKSDFSLPFDLSSGPLLRVHLYRTDNEEWVLTYVLHHIISDGWSMTILFRELLELYNGEVTGMPVELPVLNIQYRDYAAWEQSILSGDIYARHRDYWLRLLSGELPVLNLWSDRPRPAVKTYNGGIVHSMLDRDLSDSFQNLCYQSGSTLFMGLISVVNILLYRYSGQDDVIVGTPMAGREHPDLEGQIGFYVNTVALRTRLAGSKSFREILGHVRGVCLEAYEHQAYPFDKLVEELDLQRDMSRNPLFDVMVALQNIPQESLPAMDNLNFSEFKAVNSGKSKYDILFNFIECTEGLTIDFEYNADLYDQPTAQKIVAHFNKLLTAIIDSPDVRIMDLDYLGDDEFREVVEEFNSTAFIYSSERTVVDLFRDQVIISPDAPALVFEGEVLSYSDIDLVSNRLGHYILSMTSVSPGDCIGVFLERSVWNVIAMLSVFKLGCVYVPIDTGYPLERVRAILRESGAKVLLTEGPHFRNFSDICLCLSISDLETGLNSFSTSDLGFNIEWEHSSYVIYTSGSTGVPKGIEQTHRTLYNLISWSMRNGSPSPVIKYLQFSSFSFDMSIYDTLYSLCTGGELHVISDLRRSDMYSLRTYILDNGLSILSIPCAIAKTMFDGDVGSFSGHRVNKIVCAGEQLYIDGELRDFLRDNPWVVIENLYGPSETHVVTGISYSFSGGYVPEKASIGRPIDNIQIYILDSGMKPVSKGMEGEIYIGGMNVAKGYLGRPDLTLERFINNPVIKGRVYRSGDIGRWDAAGNIEYLGRSDAQVKINGYRIELEEIETVLRGHPEVRETAVTVNELESGSRYLVAYITGSANLEKDMLHSYLSEMLPGYMVPNQYVFLENLPLTATGKLDRRSLPDPLDTWDARTEYVAPGNDLERILTKIWSEVLGRERVGINDDFFELGGDSIKAIQIASRLRGYNYALKIQDILLYPKIKNLNSRVLLQHKISIQNPVTGKILLTPIQKRFFANDSPDKEYYHQSILLDFNDPIVFAGLQNSLNEILLHHDALRITFRNTKDGWIQNIGNGNVKVHLEVAMTDQEDNVRKSALKVKKSLTLGRGPLVKAIIFKGKDKDRLLIVIHHLIVDGVSWRIILQDLSTLYAQYLSNEALRLPAKTESFQHWSKQQWEYAKSITLLKEKTYWTTIDQAHSDSIPMDYEERGSLEKDSSILTFVLTEIATKKLTSDCYSAYSTEVNDILLTALNFALLDTFQMQDVGIYLEGHGREDIDGDMDVTRTVGWFTTMYPVILKMKFSNEPTRQLLEVKETLRNVPNKGIGYGILRYLNEVDFKNHTDIAFNNLGEFKDGENNNEEYTKIFRFSKDDHGSDVSEKRRRDHILYFNAIIVNGKMSLSVNYSRKQFKTKTIDSLAKAYENRLLDLINNLAAFDFASVTPSDLTFRNINIDDLLKFNKENNIEDVYTLSHMQKGLYFHWLYSRYSFSYFGQLTYKIRGEISVPDLNISYDRLVARYQVLRTFFTDELSDEILQIVVKNVGSNFIYIDSTSDKDFSLDDFKRKDKLKGFDLNRGSQMRLTVIRLDDHHHEFIWSHHHILMDGWCLNRLITEFFMIYQGVISKTAIDLPLPIPYSRYIDWLGGVNQTKSLDYWKKYLLNFNEVTGVPRQKAQSSAGFTEEKLKFSIEESLSLSIRHLTRGLGITESIFFQSVWSIVLSRYNNTTDILFGTVVSGRPPTIEHVEQMIGLFINTVPVRNEIIPSSTFSEFAIGCQKRSIESADFHYSQLADIQALSSLGRDLFDHIMIFENYPIQDSLNDNIANETSGDKISLVSSDIAVETNYDLTLIIVPDDEIKCQFNFNSHVYGKDQIEILRNHFLATIGSVLVDPGINLCEISITSNNERKLILEKFNATFVEFPPNDTILQLLDKSFKGNSGKTAITYDTRTVSYSQLNDISNKFARYLRDNYGIKPNEIVAIMLDRSEWLVISILSILKAGGAYVPLDPDFPKDRIDYIVSDCSCRLIIDEEEIKRFMFFLSSLSSKNLSYANKMSDLAYVIFTSGSTGTPKGVMIEHRGLSNLMQFYSVKGIINCTLTCNYIFDVSVLEIFRTLLSGGNLVIPERELVYSPNDYAEFLYSNKITHCYIHPFHIGEIASFLAQKTDFFLKEVIAGVESIRVTDISLLLDYDVKVVNGYGPTECTITSTTLDLNEIDLASTNVLPIGRPVSNSRVYIIDCFGGLSGIGVPGEICVGGAGVARGYLNLPELTSSRFVPDPYFPGERMYLTGDLGRWLPDGNIEFLGRSDDQVKIRGYRVELGEIENVLVGHPGIESCVAAVRGIGSDRELVCYFTGSSELSSGDLRSYLSGLLPSYMVPGHYVLLASLPLTGNGKVDRRALPDPAGLGVSTGMDYVAPSTDIERELSEVYGDVLKRQLVGALDDFFVLGGDSIKSIQIVSRLKQRGYMLTIQDVMLYPTVRDLSLRAKPLGRSSEQGVYQGIVPLGPVQLFFFADDSPDKHHYNHSVLLNSNVPVSEEALRMCLGYLVLHHDALRMVYREGPEGWEQENLGSAQGYSLDVLPYIAGESFAATCSLVQSGIDLEKGPLLRAVLFRDGGSDRLLLVAHHLVVDGVSWRILFEDLSTLYRQYLTGTILSLPAKTDSFGYWQQKLVSYGHSAGLAIEREYWSAVDSSKPAVLLLDDPSGSNLVGDASSLSFVLNREETRLLLTKCYHSFHTDINDILLSALSLALSDVFDLDRVCLKLEGHGRETIDSDTDVSRTVGWFTTIFPVVFEMLHRGDKLRHLIEVKEALHRIPNKGIGYGILRYICGSGYSLSPEVSFNYLGDFGSGVGGDGDDSLFSFSSEYHGSPVSPLRQRDSLLSVSGILVNGRISLSVAYSHAQFREETISRFVSSYRAQLVSMINILSCETERHITPVDLTYKGLSVPDVSEIGSGHTLEDVYPLGPLQEGLYYHWFSSPSSPAYFEQMSYRVYGELDIFRLESSYRTLVSRHAVLRTFFTQDYGDRLLQVVSHSIDGCFNYLDVSGDENFSMDSFKSADRLRGFDLHRGSQMRLSVICLGSKEYEFVWSHHHILMDGWCVGILIREFFQMYYSHLVEDSPMLGRIYPYSDYIKWLGTIDRESSISYWRGYLSGYDSISEVPKSRKAGPPVRKEQALVISDGLYDKLRLLSGEMGVTENSFIQTVWGMLLGIYNGSSDVVFGSVVSGRPPDIAGIEEMVGLFSNTIPVRVRSVPGTSFRDLLRAVQEQAIDSLDHHYVQLAEIQSCSSTGGILFDHILVFENYPIGEIVSTSSGSEGFLVSRTDMFNENSFDLTVVVVPGEKLGIRFTYNNNIYSDRTISRLGEHLLEVISSVLSHPDRSIGEVGYVGDAERAVILGEFNATLSAYPSEKTLVSLFEEQVSLKGDSTALVFGSNRLTYDELNTRSNRLAHYLRDEYGIRSGELVGILLDRSDWMVVSLLGVLKSGGAYVPIDPDYPADRIAYILSDSGCRTVIDSAELARFFLVMDGFSVSNPILSCIPTDLAYVIYTSGSTGTPKGVMIEHRNVVNYISWFITNFGDNCNTLLLSNITFDGVKTALFGALLSGSTLHVVERDVLYAPLKLTRYIFDNGIGFLKIIPSLLKLLVSEVESFDLLARSRELGLLVIGGDAIDLGDVSKLRACGREIRMINHYGPTETTVGVLTYEIGSVCSSIPIGRPISNSRVYIIDGFGGLSGIGVPGEICVGGAGVARGYLNLPELTSSRFVPDPYFPGERMYLTGDLGRWLPDGNIEFLGRSDDQVKIRGYRVELGEIENVLVGHPGIESCVAAVRGIGSDRELVCYFTGSSELSSGDLRSYLSGLLPSYMVPGHYVLLASLPLTGNGKVDRRALPDPAGLGVSTGMDYVAPSTDIERELVSIWEEVLGREGIGVMDNFFELGGNSIKVIYLYREIKKRYLDEIQIHEIFSNPTIFQLNKLIRIKNNLELDENILKKGNF